MKISEAKREGKAAIEGKGGRLFAVSLFTLAAAVGWAALPVPVFYLLERYADRLDAVYAGLSEILAVVASCLIIVAALFFISPLKIGVQAWLERTRQGKKTGSAAIMYWYSAHRAAKAARMCAALFALRTVWAFVFLSPGILLVAGCVWTSFRTKVSASALAALLCGGVALCVCGLVFYGITVQRYMLAEKILALAPQAKVSDAIYASVDILQGSCRKAAALKISFLPWMLGCALIFPAIYAVPYYRQTSACFAAGLIKKYGNIAPVSGVNIS